MNEIKIINAAEEYIDSFREALDSVSKEKRYLAFTEAPEVESVRKFVRRLIKDGDIQVYAIHGGRVIGWCDIIRRTRDTMNHAGALGMGILKPYRGKGLGTRLMSEVIERAKANGLEKVVLDVYAHNSTAKKLYDKFGFVKAGVKKKEVKIDGEYFDNIMMELFL